MGWKGDGIDVEGSATRVLGVLVGEGREEAQSKIDTRADKKLERVFVDLPGPKPVESRGGKRYTLLIRDECCSYTWVYFIWHKSEAVQSSEKLLVDARADRVPSEVPIVRSNNGAEFYEGAFDALCRARNITQEITTPETPSLLVYRSMRWGRLRRPR